MVNDSFDTFHLSCIIEMDTKKTQTPPAQRTCEYVVLSFYAKKTLTTAK